MLQVRSSDMLQSAYYQISEPERVFVDRLVAEAARHGRVSDLIDAPLPPELHEIDTRGWLQRPLILAAIHEQLQTLQLNEEISLPRIMRELHAIATFTLESIMQFDQFGQPQIDLENATPAQWAAIKSIEMETTESLTRANKVKIKVQMHDKLGALKMLSDMLGAYEPDNPFRKADKTRNAPSLTDGVSSQQAADEYQRFIEGE